MLLRKADRADERLEAETKSFSILGLQEPPTTKNGLPFGLDKRVLKECIKQDGHMADIVYTNTESFFTGKQGFHIFNV